jgi:hypothetical protein
MERGELRARRYERGEHIASERAGEMEADAPASLRSEGGGDVGNRVVGNGEDQNVAIERSAAIEIARLDTGKLPRETPRRASIAPRENEAPADFPPGTRERAARATGPDEYDRRISEILRHGAESMTRRTPYP